MRDHSHAAGQAARRLRKEMSLPEVLLWRQLRGNPAGVRFRRQHPLGSYVADFFCASARVVIEIDGRAHDMGDRPGRDRMRDSALAAAGFQVVRIAAADVLRDVVGVAEGGVRLCAAAPPPSGAAPLPPPPVGEDRG